VNNGDGDGNGMGMAVDTPWPALLLVARRSSLFARAQRQSRTRPVPCPLSLGIRPRFELLPPSHLAALGLAGRKPRQRRISCQRSRQNLLSLALSVSFFPTKSLTHTTTATMIIYKVRSPPALLGNALHTLHTLPYPAPAVLTLCPGHHHRRRDHLRLLRHQGD
jgi:hypothetical protein